MPSWFYFALIALTIALIVTVAWVIASERDHRRSRHHRTDPGPAPSSGPQPGRGAGSMILAEEYALTGVIPRDEWNDSIAEANGGWEHRTPLWNGHTFGCLAPDQEHPGACPEEGDWNDGRDWPVPYLPAAGPVAAGPDVMDAVLALEEEDPAGAGWTDQLLAELRDAPTVLDETWEPARCCECGHPTEGQCVYCAQRVCSPCAATGHACPGLGDERLADTGEIHLAGLRADWAAELDDQDDDAAEFISRLVSAAAELRINGLA